MNFFRCGGNGVTVTVDGVEVKDELKLSSCGTIDVSASTLPYSFQCGKAVVFNGEIHILGGGSSGSSTNYNHYKFDKNKKRWISVSTLPFEFYYDLAFVLNGEIHILDRDDQKHYKCDGTSWTLVSELPYKCRIAVALDDEIHILGSTYGSGSSTNYNHYKFDGTSWTSVGRLPVLLSSGNLVVVVDGKIHMLGSSYTGSPSSYIHYIYDNNEWIIFGTLPYNLGSGSAVVLNGEIHMLGGNYGSNETDYVYNAIKHTIIGVKAYKIV